MVRMPREIPMMRKGMSASSSARSRRDFPIAGDPTSSRMPTRWSRPSTKVRTSVALDRRMSRITSAAALSSGWMMMSIPKSDAWMTEPVSPNTSLRTRATVVATPRRRAIMQAMMLTSSTVVTAIRMSARCTPHWVRTSGDVPPPCTVITSSLSLTASSAAASWSTTVTSCCSSASKRATSNPTSPAPITIALMSRVHRWEKGLNASRQRYSIAPHQTSISPPTAYNLPGIVINPATGATRSRMWFPRPVRFRTRLCHAYPRRFSGRWQGRGPYRWSWTRSWARRSFP